MAAPVLTAFERKKALSGKKKNKKTFKNVLGLPSNLKVETHSLAADEVKKLNEVLERLLPLAKLPIQFSAKNKNEKEKILPPNESKLIEGAKQKRNQLLLGVNEVNKGIKKGLTSAVLLANDIYPQFLINHLNLSCSYNKIPFLYVPGLREITKNCLGFPCIALGFKQNFSDFTEVIKEIKILFEIHQSDIKTNSDKDDTQSEEESEGEESSSSQDSFDDDLEVKKNSFTYLYRSSDKIRIFTPKNQEGNNTQQKTDVEFISVPKLEENTSKDEELSEKGISMNLIKKQKSSKLVNIRGLEETELDEELDLAVPKKKSKISWMIDLHGNKKKFNYHPANVSKVYSNPDRFKKKNKRNRSS